MRAVTPPHDPITSYRTASNAFNLRVRVLASEFCETLTFSLEQHQLLRVALPQVPGTLLSSGP